MFVPINILLPVFSNEMCLYAGLTDSAWNPPTDSQGVLKNSYTFLKLGAKLSTNTIII